MPSSKMPTEEERFVEYLKSVENPGLRHGVRHKSPEGGTDTIGYGHKLTEEEERTGKVYGIPLNSLDEEAAQAILVKDLRLHRRRLDKALKKKHGIGIDDLPERDQYKLLDYQYNLGDAVGKFPSFTKGVVNRDINTQIKEFERFYTDADGKTHPVKERNQRFFDTFLRPEMGVR